MFVAGIANGIAAFFSSSLFIVGSNETPLLGKSVLPISGCFLVRLRGAVSSSRPDVPQGVARSSGQGWPQAIARLRGAKRP
jgi:hypothetical protein